MYRRVILSILIFCCATVSASDTSVRSIMEDTIQSITTKLSDNLSKLNDDTFLRNLVEEDLFPLVDFTYMSQQVLDNHWSSVKNTELQQKFEKGLQNHIYNVYNIALKSFDNQPITLTSVKVQKEGTVAIGEYRKALAETTIQTSGTEPAHVQYIMHFKNGKWLVYDMKVNGIGFISSFKASVQSAIDTDGLDETINSLDQL